MGYITEIVQNNRLHLRVLEAVLMVKVTKNQLELIQNRSKLTSEMD